MIKNIHVVIPMSGKGTRYVSAGYTQPKPLISINGTPMIERLLSNFSKDWNYHFILAENHKESGLVNALKKIRPNGKLHFIGPHKEGPSYAIKDYLKEIPSEDPVLVSYCDYGMNWDFKSFQDFVSSSNCDACLISYRGFHAHYLSKVNYAFSRLQGERVVEVKEKGNFTDNRENEFASGGAYYFRTRQMLEEAIDFQMKHSLEINGEYYTSLTVEAILRINPTAHVRVFEVPGFYQWGTPNDLQDFEYWEKTYTNINKFVGYERPKTNQVLMPMAGYGSRFKNITSLPKPLIKIEGRPMFLRALDCLPSGEKNVFVTRSEVVDSLRETQKLGKFVALNYVPEGQALTTELGISELNNDQDLIVTACDHGLVLAPEKWAKFKKQDYDAAIFTVKGFPGVRRNPLAYSYVDISDDNFFPKVRSVSVKNPVSENPQKDHLLVGTFWFKSAAFLRESIDDLKTENKRVNGELYLDAVFNNIIRKGLKVCAIELDGYMNWGDPDSLKEALYWQEIFLGRRLSIRNPFPGVEL